MFKSLDSMASVVGIFMYLTISKCKQILGSRKGLDYNTATGHAIMMETDPKWTDFGRDFGRQWLRIEWLF